MSTSEYNDHGGGPTTKQQQIRQPLSPLTSQCPNFGSHAVSSPSFPNSPSESSIVSKVNKRSSCTSMPGVVPSPNAEIDVTGTEALESKTSDDQKDCLRIGVRQLSERELRRIPRCDGVSSSDVESLIVDHNCLERLDNLFTYHSLVHLSACHNMIVRMFQVGKLLLLKSIDLSHNSISVIEGLKDLKFLTSLNLSYNNIKLVEGLSNNFMLVELNLSYNEIPSVSDLSHLKQLKILNLHRNKLEDLKFCDRSLPHSIQTLTLHSNEISDLTELGHLTSLSGTLESISIYDNPMVSEALKGPPRRQFDYRPYLLNWCLNLKSVDGRSVNAKESLKGEWMYSQSKGRQFTSGEHAELVEYLIKNCPSVGGIDDWQEDDKLNLVLTKVKEHQSSLTQMSQSLMIPHSTTNNYFHGGEIFSYF